MAVNALGFLDSICITVFISLCDIVGISDRLADHRYPRSGSCDRSDPDVAIKAYGSRFDFIDLLSLFICAI